MVRVRITSEQLEDIYNGWLEEEPSWEGYNPQFYFWLQDKNIELECIQNNIFLISKDSINLTSILMKY